jgi:hypothetical protein
VSIYIRAPLEDGPGVRTLELVVSGKLVEEDYNKLVERTEELVANHGSINMIIELKDFHGWTAGAAWEDLKFGIEHFNHIDRMAIVGESVWEEGMAMFIKPFTTAEVKYFDHKHSDDAYNWIHEDDY